jgi:hypothetical protein
MFDSLGDESCFDGKERIVFLLLGDTSSNSLKRLMLLASLFLTGALYFE